MDKINVAEINKNKLTGESTQVNLASTFEDKPKLMLEGYYSPSINQVVITTTILWPNGIEPEDHNLYRIETESKGSQATNEIFENNNSTYVLPSNSNSDPITVEVTAKLIKSPSQQNVATATGKFLIFRDKPSILNAEGNFISFDTPEITPNFWVTLGNVYVPSGIVRNNEQLYLYAFIYKPVSFPGSVQTYWRTTYLGKSGIYAGGFSTDVQFPYHDYIPNDAKILVFVSKQNFPDYYFTTLISSFGTNIMDQCYQPGFYWVALKGMRDAVQPDITLPNRLRTEVDYMNLTIQNNVLYFQSLNLFPGGIIDP
ncbi:hypothetical protein ACS5PU_00410 [Pedobacter sp. GSP4]|uniref:hypothetical protein n=1 Tax=Pedobacter sp. GSP4 TaxID=3453716 RepID=UPI003EEF41FC